MMNTIIEKLQEMMGDGYIVSPVENWYNNHIQRRGLTIRKKVYETMDVAPCFYPEDMRYDSIDHLCEEIKRKYNEYLNDAKKLEETIESLKNDKKLFLNSVRFRVVNEESNAELVSGCPHIKIAETGLVALFQVSVGDNFFVINEKINFHKLSNWELYDNAKENEENVLVDMGNELRALGMVKEDINTENIPFVIASNKKRTWGASAILNQKLLDQFEAVVGEFYILPSSVHEVIFYPAFMTSGDKRESIDGLKKMVKEVNDSMVQPHEILSYDVFRYKNGILSIA